MVTEISPEVRRLADALAPWSTGHCGCGRRTGLTAPRWIHCAERSTTRGFCRAHRCATRPWRPNGDGDWRFRHTAAAIARKVGLSDAVSPPERLSDEVSADEFGSICSRYAGGKDSAGTAAPRPYLQTLAFVTLVFGNQALLYALRDRRHLWSSKPSIWVVVSSAADIAITSALALSGTLMAPLPWRLLLAVLCVSAGFALLIDKIKLTVMAAFDIA